MTGSRPGASSSSSRCGSSGPAPGYPAATSTTSAMARPSPLTTTVRIADSLPRQRQSGTSLHLAEIALLIERAAERLGQALPAGLGEPQRSAGAPPLEPAQVEKPAKDG